MHQHPTSTQQDIFEKIEMNNSDIIMNDDKTHNGLGNSFEIPLTLAKVTFLILGIPLQSLIVFFEMLGRDSQKRGLINRVSKIFLKYFC